MKFLLICLLAVPGFAQSPIIGNLSDLQGKSRFYVIADAEARTAIADILSKHWKVVNDPAESEFVVEYKPLTQSRVGTINIERGELLVYFARNEQRILAWSQVATGGAYKADTPKKLAKKLRSAVKKP